MNQSASHPRPPDAQPSAPLNGTTIAKSPSEADPTVFGWTDGDRQVALIAGAAILVLLLICWGQLTWRGSPAVEIHRLETAENRFQLDINSATWVEWMQLEGVGEALSRRIVDDREQNGPFVSIDDVQRVRGIGPRTIEELRPWLHCADCLRQSATIAGDDP